MTSDSGVARKLAVLGHKSTERSCSGSVAYIQYTSIYVVLSRLASSWMQHQISVGEHLKPFLCIEAFETLPVDRGDQHLVVDWDKDGDLDIIKMKGIGEGMDLYDQQDGHFVKIQPSPFKDVKASACPPAVVDWNDDGRLDLLVATTSGVRYYERVDGGGLAIQTGNCNPLQSIGGIHPCGHLSIADWDGDGDMDILIADLADSLLYFEQQPQGKFQFVEANPFLKIQDRIKFRKPLMVDWNSDGLMDLVLFQQPRRPASESWLKGSFLFLPLVFDIARQPCFLERFNSCTHTWCNRVVSSNAVEQRKKGRFTLEDPSKVARWCKLWPQLSPQKSWSPCLQVKSPAVQRSQRVQSAGVSTG